MRKIIFICLLMTLAQIGLACEQTEKICIDGPSTKIIDGRSVRKECWQYRTTYKCYGQEYKDYCQGISQVAGCSRITTECTKQKGDICLEYLETFRCGNLLNSTVKDTEFLNSEYTIITDVLNEQECKEHVLNTNCSIIESKCVEGAETRKINGLEVYKDCWRTERKYACINGAKVSDCDQYEKTCTLKAQTCLSQDSTGHCLHTEKQYACKVTEIQATKSCSKVKYCIGDKCEDQTIEGNNNMGRALSALSILTNIKKDFSEQECSKGANFCRIFQGNAHFCRINPVGSRNCCKEKGWANDLKLAECNEQEKSLAKKREIKTCHLVGSYCAKKLLGMCLETKRSFCCFDSKISRIIHEQGRGQLGISWGTAKLPNCQALSLEQLQQLNFDNIDLSEAYIDTINKVNLKAHDKLADKATEKINSQQYQNEIARRIRGHYEK